MLPQRTLFLQIPSSVEIVPSAFNFIFIPYTKLIAIFDINKSIIRLIDTDLGEIYKTSNKYLPTFVPFLRNYI